MQGDAAGRLVVGHQLTPLRQAFRTSRADLYGGAVAQQELIEAVLAHTAIDEVHLFNPPGLHAASAQDPGLLSLQERFGAERVRSVSFTDVPQLARCTPYVMVSQGYLSTAFHQVRRATGRAFPVCTIQHSCHLSSRHTFAQSLDAFLAMDETDVLVTVSEAGHQTMDRLFALLSRYVRDRLGVEPACAGRLVPIPLGINTDQYVLPDKAACRRIMEIPPESVVMLYVGRFAEDYKADLEPLLIALGRLLVSHPEALLLLAGREASEGYGRYLQMIASRLGVDRQVRVVSDFPHFTKLALYGCADLFVSPADNVQETFGLALIEAMAAGLPVVASDWSGYRDIVIHGETGFLVPTAWSPDAARAITSSAMLYNDHYAEGFIAQRTNVDLDAMCAALEQLIASRPLRERLGEAGRRHAAATFDLRHVVRRYEETWRDQLAQAARRGPVAPGVVLDAEAMFDPFATAPFDLASPLTPTADCDDLLTVLLPVQRIPDIAEPGTGRHVVTSIVDACRSTPRTASDLLADGVAPSAGLLLWLMKKGYLRAIRPS